MNSYIGGVRRKESGLFHRISYRFSDISRKFKRQSTTLPEGLSEHKIHIEEEKPGFFARLFKGKTAKEQEEIEEEIEKKPEAVKEEMEEVAEDYETMDEVEKEVEKKKEGIFSRFMKIFKGSPKDDDEEDVPVEQVERVIAGKPAVHVEPDEAREDLKKISKITLHVIQQLPKEKQDEFKQSPEFSEYKTILEKHGLVK
jgi:hypothetical protein